MMLKILVFVLTMVSINLAKTEITAYDGFDYAIGESLSSQNGGNGWSSPWTTSTGLGGSIVAGLTHRDANGDYLMAGGNAYSVNASILFYQTIRDTVVDFGAGESTVWVGFIVQQAESSFGVNYAAATLGTGYSFNSNAMLGGISGILPHAFVHNFYSGSQGVSDETTILDLGESAFIVLKFDFAASGNDTLSLWYNPLLGDNSAVPLLTFSGKNYAPIISGITLAHGDHHSFVFDEIRIGTDFASVAPIDLDLIFIDGFE